MIALFAKECKTIGKNLAYWLFILISIISLYTQMPNTMEKRVEEPKPGQASYGETKFVENPEVIIPEVTAALMNGFVSNSFTTYPIGFYKSVKLNEKKRGELAEILAELTTYSKEELLALTKEEWVSSALPPAVGADGSIQMNEADEAKRQLGQITSRLAPDITYERFKELIDRADDLLGGGSSFDRKGGGFQRNFGRAPITYEDAVNSYQDILEKDKISNAYARLFCDYFGIVLGILPVFVAVAVGMRDSRGKMQPMAYTRRISSLRLTAVRYCALLIMLFLPVLALSLGASLQLFLTYQGSGLAFDHFAFLKNAVLWLLPTTMASSAVGFFLTQLTDSPIAIIVQAIWWFVDVFSGSTAVIGGGQYGWSLIPRHNSIGNTGLYLENFQQLLKNRLAYTAFALVLIGIAAGVYELKRRGKLDVWRKVRAVLPNRKVKS